MITYVYVDADYTRYDYTCRSYPNTEADILRRTIFHGIWNKSLKKIILIQSK